MGEGGKGGEAQSIFVVMIQLRSGDRDTFNTIPDKNDVGGVTGCKNDSSKYYKLLSRWMACMLNLEVRVKRCRR